MRSQKLRVKEKNEEKKMCALEECRKGRSRINGYRETRFR